jgi:hypothetical protein
METTGPIDDPPVDATTPRSTPLSGGSLTGVDWPAQAADAIVNVVGTVRDRTTAPVIKAARAVVFGVFAGILIVTIAVLAIIGTVRLLDEALPYGVWLAYLILGIAFTGAGALLFRRRNAPTRSM